MTQDSPASAPGPGVTVQGDVHVEGGDFVARDQFVNVTFQGAHVAIPSPQAVAAHRTALRQRLEQDPARLDAIMEFFAEDCCIDLRRGPHPWGRRLTGKAQIRAGCASRFADLPDAH